MINKAQKQFSHGSPFVRSGFSVKKINIIFIILLLLQILVLIFERDFIPVINIFISALSVCLTEFIISYYVEGRINISLETIVSGITIGFLLPVNIGFLFVFFVTSISFVISKIIFGGTGRNWINPIMFAAAVSYICKPEIYPAFFADISSLKTNGSIFPLLQINGFSRIKADMPITSALNSLFLHKAGVTLPEGYISLFWNSAYPIPAFRYNLLTVLSSIVLFSLKAADRLVSFVFIISYSVLVWIFAQVPVTGLFFTGDILCAVMTSGVLFTAFFVLTEYSSSPKTVWGKILSGLIIGSFSFVICGAGASPAGLAYAVLFANMINPIIERCEKQIQNKKRIKLWNSLHKIA